MYVVGSAALPQQVRIADKSVLGPSQRYAERGEDMKQLLVRIYSGAETGVSFRENPVYASLS